MNELQSIEMSLRKSDDHIEEVDFLIKLSYKNKFNSKNIVMMIKLRF
jgi:hypothetical protein